MIENKEQGKEEDKQGDNNQEKWITLTCGKEIKHLAKLLKGTNVKRAYKISNTTEKILGYKNDGAGTINLTTVVYTNSNVQSGGKKYTGHTGII